MVNHRRFIPAWAGNTEDWCQSSINLYSPWFRTAMALTNKYLINGLLAPFLLVAILIIAANKKLMQAYDRKPRQPFVHKTGWTDIALYEHYIFKVRSVPIAQAFSHAYEQIFGSWQSLRFSRQSSAKEYSSKRSIHGHGEQVRTSGLQLCGL